MVVCDLSTTIDINDAGPLSRGQIVFMVAALVTSVIAFQLNASMLAPAIGAINGAMGPNAYVAMSNFFFLAGAVACVVLVRWSDYVGRKRVLISIMVLMCIGTVLCIVSTSLPVVVLGRILQGGCVISFPLSYLIQREHLSPMAFGACVGVVSSINGGVAGVDALLGGVMVDHLGYRSIFVLILAIGVAAIGFAWKAVPADPPRGTTAGRMDWWGAALLASTVGGVNMFLIAGGTSGWLSTSTVAWIFVGVLSLVGLIVVDTRIRSPLIAIEHLRSRQEWPVVTTTILALASFFVVLNFIVPHLAVNADVGFGANGTTTALLFLTPAALVGVVSAPVFGRLAIRIGFVTTARLGILATLLVTVVVAVFAMNDNILFGLMAAFGLTYNGALLTSLSAMGVAQSCDEEPGALPGITNSCFGIGAAVGFAWAGAVVGSGTEASYLLALWLCVAIGAVALLSSLILQPKPFERRT
ncbi:MFS transporter [Mycobacterium haemophilum]|uniref:MFS transporter n=1 Tax=Mycobacterium haemophilum TaxID=29311 RepID=A0A0I9VGQ5_9MYCO|nr:MFS transporter [Mycobacterium haemophilum]KLO36874.1 MFS transporter [Mycobacterium haemophilum]KLO42894.1 MFS transporter [Mycobacterium haemophilum]KLO55731.1 MFS transporter [Mycobacterium haemophilum]